jgi:hypothetical protein
MEGVVCVGQGGLQQSDWASLQDPPVLATTDLYVIAKSLQASQRPNTLCEPSMQLVQSIIVLYREKVPKLPPRDAFDSADRKNL